jgi:hypothetical protein
VKVALDQNAFVRLVGRAGATVACVSGTLWITRDGCWHDVMLQPGQMYRVEDDTRVLVCGLGPSVAWVSLPRRAASRWQRLAAAMLAAWRRVGALASGQSGAAASRS